MAIHKVHRTTITIPEEGAPDGEVEGVGEIALELTAKRVIDCREATQPR